MKRSKFSMQIGSFNLLDKPYETIIINNFNLPYPLWVLYGGWHMLDKNTPSVLYITNKATIPYIPVM